MNESSTSTFHLKSDIFKSRNKTLKSSQAVQQVAHGAVQSPVFQDFKTLSGWNPGWEACTSELTLPRAGGQIRALDLPKSLHTVDLRWMASTKGQAICSFPPCVRSTKGKVDILWRKINPNITRSLYPPAAYQEGRGCVKHFRTFLVENCHARASWYRQAMRLRSSLTVSLLLSKSSSLLWSLDYAYHGHLSLRDNALNYSWLLTIREISVPLAKISKKAPCSTVIIMIKD